MAPQAECMLVLIGATPEGRNELVGFQARGLALAPEMATGDGALGFLEGARAGLVHDPASAL